VNASSGLKNVKGNPALIVESAKPGVFPEDLARNGSVVYAADYLPKVLRFRHGGTAPDRALAGYDYTIRNSMGVVVDRLYQPRQRMNVGYLDGHVETLNHWEMFDLTASGTRPRPKHPVWFGGRRGSDFSY
jgi:prepilin-type processing-associated H-X9-DG protein